MVWVAGKEFFDALAILLQLLFQNDQAFNQAQNQQALGTLNGLGNMPLSSITKGG